MNQLDRDIQDLKHRKIMLSSLEKLMHNPDFKKVILEYYLKELPVELVMQKASLTIEQAQLDAIDLQLRSIAMFKYFLDTHTSQIADIDIKISEAETLRDEQTRNT